MEVQQNATQNQQPKDSEESAVSLLTPQQEDYVAFVATGGLIPSDDGPGVKMTVETFAHNVGVDRVTLWRWRKTIPNFWDLVNAKRKEIGGKDRLANVWNGVYLKAAAGNAEAAKLYLANFDPSFRMPMQKVEHEAGDSLTEALSLARQRGNLIEAEVIDEPDQRS